MRTTPDTRRALLTTSARGRDLIAAFEGVVLRAYPDPATGGVPWTIGVGHTAAAGAPIVRPGMTITRPQAFEILERDLKTFEGHVSSDVRVAVSQLEFDAMTSLCFNIGPGNFGKSSIVRHLNVGKRAAAADAFRLWNKAAGKVLSGLVRRREAERLLFLSGQYSASIAANDDEAVGVVLSRGAPHPDAVRALQTDLVAIGLLPADGADGDFGQKTLDAVLLFQKRAGLTIDGRVGPATRALIARAVRDAGGQVAVAMYPLPGQALDAPIAA